VTGPNQEYTVRKKLEVQGNTARGSNFHRLLTKLKKKDEPEEEVPPPSTKTGKATEKVVKKDLK
jgi:hypothetical protein